VLYTQGVIAMTKKQIYLTPTSMEILLDCKNASKYLSFGNSIHMTLADFNISSDKKHRTSDTPCVLFQKKNSIKRKINKYYNISLAFSISLLAKFHILLIRLLTIVCKEYCYLYSHNY